MPNYDFPPGLNDHIHKIITIKGVIEDPFTPFTKPQIPRHEQLLKLHRILQNEYPESSIGVLYADMKPYDVIIFENVDDTLSFALKYGHIYGTGP